VVAGTSDFGWEGVIAIGTLFLAVGTVWLAATTRRLARLTSKEVQAQWRPLILPGLTAVEAGERENMWLVPIRNAGTGPALTIRAADRPALESGVPPLVSALAPGEGTRIPAFSDRPDILSLYIEYFDLSGAVFGTRLFIGAPPMEGQPRGIDVTLSQGERFFRHGGFAPGKVPTRAPLRRRIAAANNALWLHPGAPPRPLAPRLKEAYSALYPRRWQTFSQRVGWALDAFRRSRNMWIPPKVPRGLRLLYKWRYRVMGAYRIFRTYG
jgi:hypothetical protein